MVHLTQREKRLGMAMAAVIAVWAVYGLAVKPAQERIATLQRVIPEKQADLSRLQEAGAQYIALQQDVQAAQTRIARQDESFELTPFLEGLISRHQLDTHLAHMDSESAPSQAGYAETAVTIEFEAITLRQLLVFLEAVENSDAVTRIASLQVRQDRTQEGTLAATVRIVNPRRQANSSNTAT